MIVASMIKQCINEFIIISFIISARERLTGNFSNKIKFTKFASQNSDLSDAPLSCVALKMCLMVTYNYHSKTVLPFELVQDSCITNLLSKYFISYNCGWAIYSVTEFQSRIARISQFLLQNSKYFRKCLNFVCLTILECKKHERRKAFLRSCKFNAFSDFKFTKVEIHQLCNKEMEIDWFDLKAKFVSEYCLPILKVRPQMRQDGRLPPAYFLPSNFVEDAF